MDQHTLFMWAIVVTCCVVLLAIFIVGLFTCLFNFFVARIFSLKRKLSPSDLLIIAGLIGDGLYGFIFASAPFAVYAFLSGEGPERFLIKALPVFWLILDSTSTLYSLLMIFFMSLNRYIAVIKPFKYKIIFRRRNVLLMISFVIMASTIFLIIGVFLIAFAEKIRYRRYDDCYTIDGDYSTCRFSSYDYYYEIKDYVYRSYIFVWPEIQLIIVIIDSLLMIFVYIGVAHSYEIKIFACFTKRKSQPFSLQIADESTTTDLRDASCADKQEGWLFTINFFFVIWLSGHGFIAAQTQCGTEKSKKFI